MKKKVSVMLIVFLLIASLSGCKDGSQSQSAGNTQAGSSEAGDPTSIQHKNEITIAQAEDIKVLDPHDCVAVSSYIPICQIFSSLVTLDNDMNIVGDLAEEWRAVSDLEWEFKLKQGVKWHDGSDFTAKDIKFSLERQKNMPKAAYMVEDISEIEVIDDYTVVMRTEKPSGALLLNLAISGSRIVPEKAVTELGDAEFNNHPVGTGPMKFEEWKLGDKLVLIKNNEYFGDNSECADKLIFKGIPEGTSRTIALETGEVDLIIGVEATDKVRVEENPKLKLYEAELPRVEYFAVNCQKPPFDNKLVRQALNYAIDKESVNLVATDGRAKIANTVVGPSTMGYNKDLQPYPYDPEKAKELLKEAGYEDGFSTSIWVYSDVRNRMAQVVQANLADVGVTADIELLEVSAYLERTAAGEHETTILAWEANGDGDLAMYSQFHSSQFGAAGNRAFYYNPEVDRILDDARTTIDTDMRNKLYEQAQVVVMEDSPWTPLYFPMADIGAQADLKGVEMHPTGLNPYFKLHY